jgi:hypothetical protein
MKKKGKGRKIRKEAFKAKVNCNYPPKGCLS